MKPPITRFALMLCLLASSVVGQGIRNSLIGVVSDQRGKPVQYASVTSESAKAPVITNDDGLFILELLSTVKDGQLVPIHIEKKNYRPLTKNVPYPGPLGFQFTLIALEPKSKSGTAKPSPQLCSHDGQASRFRDELKKYGLPPDLYDRECQLQSLTIRQGGVTDLDWLDSTPLTEFTIASSGLTSIDGLSRISKLESVSLDLSNAPLKSLSAISAHPQLHTLALHGIRSRILPPINDFPNLKSLELDLQRSSISSLPDLAGCPELHDVLLNLRATDNIFSAPSLSGLSYLQSVTLFLDNSAVRSLKPLAAIDNLHMLRLTLDGTQLPLLSDLNGSPGPQFLSVFLTSPPNSAFPNLSGIHNLIGLTLQMPGSRGLDLPDNAPVPDVTYLHQLQSLTLSLKTSTVEEVPRVGQITGLRILALDLQQSSVQHLPDISNLHDLEQLTLNVDGTAISELPNFAHLAPGLAKLKELNLFLASSQIHSLGGLEHIAALSTLRLDIRGTKIADLKAITRIKGLDTLSLRLQWSQLADLPDLQLLKNVTTLELELDDSWLKEELPALPANLKKLTLVLRKSDIRDLTPVSRLSKLEELHLDLQGAETQVLPDLHQLKHLRFVGADIRHSGIPLSQTANLSRLREITLDKTFSSLQDLPSTVKSLSIAP